MPTSWREWLIAHVPWKAKEALVAAEALRLRRQRRWGDYETVRRAYAWEQYASLSATDLRAHQLARLQELVAYARQQSVFYRDRLPTAIHSLDDLAQIPALTRSDVRTNYRAMLAQERRGQPMALESTSGSTGSPLQFYAPPEGVRARFAIIDAYLAYFGCPYGTRRVRLSWHWFAPPERTHPPFWVYNRVDNQLHMSCHHLDRDTAPAYVAQLNTFQPLYMTGYGHMLYLLARHILAHGGRRFAPRVLFTDGEPLGEEQRAIIEEGLGAPCYDAYGLREMNWVAAHCCRHRYHTMPLSSILEIVDEAGQPLAPGEVGRIVVTDLTQHAFPLVRYDTGDLGVLSAETCSCDWHSPVLQSIEGRALEYITTPRGRMVTTATCIGWIGQHILETQIVQTHSDRIVLRVVPAEGFQPADMAPMVTDARDYLGADMRVDWEVVDHITRTGRGKSCAVVREDAL